VGVPRLSNTPKQPTHAPPEMEVTAMKAAAVSMVCPRVPSGGSSTEKRARSFFVITALEVKKRMIGMAIARISSLVRARREYDPNISVPGSRNRGSVLSRVSANEYGGLIYGKRIRMVL